MKGKVFFLIPNEVHKDLLGSLSSLPSFLFLPLPFLWFHSMLDWRKKRKKTKSDPRSWHRFPLLDFFSPWNQWKALCIWNRIVLLGCRFGTLVPLLFEYFSLYNLKLASQTKVLRPREGFDIFYSGRSLRDSGIGAIWMVPCYNMLMANVCQDREEEGERGLFCLS